MSKTSDALDALTAEVTRAKTVDDSAAALLAGLSALLLENANNPEAIQALAASLKSQSDDLAAAVSANTPAATA